MHEEDEQPLEGSEDDENYRKQVPDHVIIYFLSGKQTNPPTKTEQERECDGDHELLPDGHVPVCGRRLLEFSFLAILLEELHHDQGKHDPVEYVHNHKRS